MSAVYHGSSSLPYVPSPFRWFGSASDNLNGSWDDEDYYNILIKSKEFGEITPANAMKWGLVEPEKGQYNYTGGDNLLKAAKKAGKPVRGETLSACTLASLSLTWGCIGHALLWHSQLPKFVEEITDAEVLRKTVKEHIKHEASHYRGKLIAWDVVNEPFEDDGTMRQTIFYKLLGENYIADAFR